MVFIAIFFGSIGLFLALVHINPYAQQQGLNATQANLLIGLIGMGNIGGRLVLGRIGDRMGARRFGYRYVEFGPVMRLLECGAQLYRAGDFRAVIRRGQRRLYCAVSGSGQYMVRHC